jgi:hypothetical protein
MVGSTNFSSWYCVATPGSQDGGVAATQASALVTRPTCSWTRTCCSEVPQLDSPGLVRGHDVLGELAVVQLSFDLERDELVGKGAGCRLELQVIR